jgi:extradiol dioxygenase family protein
LIGAGRVDFIGVPVRDVAVADQFYGESLGLRRNPNSSDRWIESYADGTTP